ncbi:molybdopterin-dependent oxidoreductase [Thermoplasmatales archaeon AK]|nr:molybdopterin-dependent oxidoreductase [Thermoplasmatales archaeon AK]
MTYSASDHLTYAGTYSNAFNDVYLGAVDRASRRLREKVLKLASKVSGLPEGQIVLHDNSLWDSESGKKLMTIPEVAKIAYNRLLSFPKGEEPGLKAVAGYLNPTAKPFKRDNFNVQLTHSNSTHICYVEVNPENWNVYIRDYCIAHDAGRVINPGIVDGLVIGSTISGIGGSLYEEFVFDENENNLSLTFGEYLKPTTTESPDLRIAMLESPAPNTVYGTKAVGEGGAITSLAAVASAVEDALSPYGIEIEELPITPEKIWKWINERKAKGVH